MPGRPILIVDDDIDHAVILRTVLASVAPDATTEVCTDPGRMPDVVIESATDALVFMDRRLGGADSIAYLDAVREARPDLRVVLLSSALAEEDRMRALDAGASEAIEKPGTLAEWRALLARILGPDERSGDAAIRAS